MNDCICSMKSDGLHEECGVFGISSTHAGRVVGCTYLALYALQHRGQESCGIAVNHKGHIGGYMDTGLVPEVFTKDRVEELGQGHMAVGHVRYGTYGGRDRANAQPLITRHIRGDMALAHNGALVNARELKEQLEMEGAIFHTTSDSEVISYVITKARLNTDTTEQAILQAMDQIKGAYSLVVMTPGKLIAVRDPIGWRPLCIGRLHDSVIFASESCALDALGAEFVRDVKPGEVIVAEGDQYTSITEKCPKDGKGNICVFEYIYFARPDSVIEGASVHNARLRAGAFLALEAPVHADVVIGVPDSGLDAALGFARQSGIPYGVGFIKNRYVGRTFIQPAQEMRENAVQIKLNVLAETVRGKRVVMVDDSIVRGTTSANIVKMLRAAGATEVHMRVSSPPFLNPCYFGTDIDSRENLISCRLSAQEIAQQIGVDSLHFLNLRDVHMLAESADIGFCDGCFSGVYPIEVDEAAL